MSEGEIHGECAVSELRAKSRESAVNAKTVSVIKRTIQMSIALYVFFKICFCRRVFRSPSTALMHIQCDLGTICTKAEDLLALRITANCSEPQL